jgi:hypothetical protein
MDETGTDRGPVNALAKALAKDLGPYQAVIDDLRLVDYKVRITQGGTDAVTRVIAAKPRGYLAALTHFQRLVKLDIDRRTARVENAVDTSPAMMKSLEEGLTRRYGPGLSLSYFVNPSLIGGIKIRVGSDIYDGSVAGRLAALEAAL